MSDEEKPAVIVEYGVSDAVAPLLPEGPEGPILGEWTVTRRFVVSAGGEGDA